MKRPCPTAQIPLCRAKRVRALANSDYIRAVPATMPQSFWHGYASRALSLGESLSMMIGNHKNGPPAWARGDRYRAAAWPLENLIHNWMVCINNVGA